METGKPGNVYILSVSLPMAITFYRDGHILEYSKNDRETEKVYQFEFPKDYSKISLNGYASAVELEAAFSKHWPAFRLELRNKTIQPWLYEAKMEISSNFKRSLEKLDIPVYYIKNKKGGYEEVDELIIEYKSALQAIQNERNKGKNVNWHSLEIKQSFVQLTLKWEQLINTLLKANKLSPDQEMGLWANYCWSLFFSGEFDLSVEKANEFSQRQNENPKNFKKVIKFEKFISFAIDYKERYNQHKTTYGW